MRSTRLSVVAALVLGVAGSCRGDAETDEPRVTVVMENVGETAKFSVNGVASFLPDGTLLHITVVVRDHHPPIEAGMFRVPVLGGRFAGQKEWPKRTFAPLAYKTNVVLYMEVQNPAVKRFLSKELGYGAEQIETISAAETFIGTEEERAAFQLQTLRTLNDFLQRAKGLHGRLTQMMGKPATDPSWDAGLPSFIEDLKRTRDELLALQDTRVVWFDIGLFNGLEQAIGLMSLAMQKHQEADGTATEELSITSNSMRIMQDNIAARLPAAPDAPREGK